MRCGSRIWSAFQPQSLGSWEGLKKIWVLDISEPEIGKPSANGLIVDFILALSAPHGLSYNNSVLLSAQKSLQTMSK